jgi:amino acid transporter
MKQNFKFLLILIVLLIVAMPSSTQAVQNCDPNNLGTGQVPSTDESFCTCPPGQGPERPAATERCQLINPAPGQLVGISDFGALLGRIIKIFLTFAGAIAVIFLIIGGFQYISARGNEEAMEKAKKTITGAVIGIIIIVMAFAIVLIVNNLLTDPNLDVNVFANPSDFVI